MCLVVWAKLVTAPADHRVRLPDVEEDPESSGSLIILLHLFDSIGQLQWIKARSNLSLLNIPTMTIQTGTRTTRSQPNHPKSEYQTPLKIILISIPIWLMIVKFWFYVLVQYGNYLCDCWWLHNVKKVIYLLLCLIWTILEIKANLTRACWNFEIRINPIK